MDEKVIWEGAAIKEARIAMNSELHRIRKERCREPGCHALAQPAYYGRCKRCFKKLREKIQEESQRENKPTDVKTGNASTSDTVKPN